MRIVTHFPSTWTEEEKELYHRWNSGIPLNEAEWDVIQQAINSKGHPTAGLGASDGDGEHSSYPDPYDPHHNDKA